MATTSVRVNSWFHFGRRLVSAAAIYALVTQPLLLAVLGAASAQASIVDEVSLSQLCLHQTDGSPVTPVDQQRHIADNHCFLCFAGAFHFLDAPYPTTACLVDPKAAELHQSVYPLRLTSSSQYSVARPRGPPLSA
jgi:hypothetical protein